MNWNIVELNRKTADGFVHTCHWTCTATDGPYENLTQEQVLGWVWEQIDKAEIEANLTKQIQAQKNPVSVAGVPWNE
jgi:hypothetical protein